MDAYPEVLLVGVSPLVLAVNAIPPAAATNATTRSLFDRFLDALACMDDERNSAGQEATKKSRTVSLFRPHNSSDEEDDSDSSDEEEEDGRRGGFGAFGGGRNRRPRSAAPGRNSSTSSASTVRTTVAQALDRGQGFFQRARIQAVSHRHAFPPSKDPDGSRNWTAALRASASDHDSFFAQHPVTGILPAGWLEKHVNAMPSVLVVVCTVCGSQELQAESDAFLYATVEHLAFSLVAKRRCQIHVVGLMEESLSPLQAEGWSRAILDRLLYQADEEDGGSPQASAANPLVRLTLLNTTSDLEASAAVAQPAPLQDLYTKVRHDCGAYYGAQVRRCRTKLRLLREATASSTASSASHLPPPPLLPLWIRYTFKMAIFYEFQWKHRKSLRYLAESYQYAVAYYQYLEQRQELASPHASPESSPRRHARAVVADDHVEVALASPTVDWTKQVNDPPDDMIYQCRQVADWLSFKLTSAALESHTLTGLGAANDQWRQHGRVFLIPQAVIPAWYDWAYIGRQRIVMSQLVERHMPRVLATTTEVIPEEWLLRCSPWRVMESVVEALLRLSREVDLARQGLDEVSKSSSGETSDLHRAPFVGGLDSHGLTPLLLEECRKNPRETALQMVLRAITLFEQELEREKRGFYAEDSFAESSSSRTGARLYYLAGGILLGQKRHQEAAGHLEKAVKLSKGWPGLELAVRKMLIECYETHVPTNRDSSESSLTLASMILDSYFNAEMSSGDLRRALGHFASMSGGQSVLKWYRECFNDEDSALPFTFEVTFPENIFATVGDCVKASILLKSNLDYGVHVNSLVLLSLAGDLPIASMDMMRAKNASEGIDGGIIIQRNGEIIITTELVLPKDLSSIAFDEGGNGGELQGVSGKGSFAKSARPRTAAMTSAAGARMLSADQLPPENQNAQGWSMRFLGGKPLKCDGVRMVFYPVQAEKASRGGGEDITPIELTIEKKKARTEANIRRTPFEEENYIASAWSRPQIFPLSHGPRSLRVLSPRAEMVVTNMTDPLTDGKAIEGTVNRVLLKLQAGPREECSDIKYNVSCFSVLMSPEGVTKRLVPENELAESETSVDMSNAAYRTPTMVSRDESSRFATASSGYQVPVGWSVSGNGQGFAGEPLPKLKGSEACYVPLDFFRPSADLGDATSSDLCKTDFYVTVVYKQERPASKKRVTRARRTARRRPVARPGRGRGTGGKEEQSHQEDSTATTAGETSDTADISDEVSLEYSGTILWGRPVSASFEQGAIQGYPSGKLHPSNSLTAETSTHEISLIHGERTTQKCILQAAEQDLKVELVAARFEGTKDPFQTALLSGKNGTVYEADSRDPSRILSGSSKFSLVYSVRTNLSENTPGPVTGSLGTLNVDWLPRPLELPFEVSSDGKLGGVTGQGPLALEKQASSVRFSCPPCHVERAPFSASLSVDPPIPKLGQGFDVRYRVENRTNLQQTVTVHWSDHEETPTLLVSGLIEGSLTLGPGESQTVAYTAVALVSGHIKLPAASLISTKFKTRVVNDEFRHAVFVQP
jgi:hypothetical protein